MLFSSLGLQHRESHRRQAGVPGKHSKPFQTFIGDPGGSMTFPDTEIQHLRSPRQTAASETQSQPLHLYKIYSVN